MHRHTPGRRRCHPFHLAAASVARRHPLHPNIVFVDPEHKHDCQPCWAPASGWARSPGLAPDSHRRRGCGHSAELAPGPCSRPSGRDARCSSSRRPRLDGAPRRSPNAGTAGARAGRRQSPSRAEPPPRQARSPSPLWAPLRGQQLPRWKTTRSQRRWPLSTPRPGRAGQARSGLRQASSANAGATATAEARCTGRGVGERCPPSPALFWSPLLRSVRPSTPLRSVLRPPCPAPPRGRSAGSARRPAALARVLWRSLPPQKLGPAAAAARWGAPMVPAPAAGGPVRCRPPRRRNLGEVSERVGEYRAAAPRRSPRPPGAAAQRLPRPRGRRAGFPLLSGFTSLARGSAADRRACPTVGAAPGAGSPASRCCGQCGAGAGPGPRRQLWPGLGRRAGGENFCHVPCCGWWMGCRGREA